VLQESMASGIPEDAHDPVSDADTHLLIDRIRIGLWILLASNVVFALGDLGLDRSLLVSLLLLKLVQVLTIIGAFVALRMRTDRAWTIGVGLLTVAVAASMTAASGVVTRETVPTTILGATGVMLTGTLLPWGLWPQVGAAGVTGAAIAANAYLLTGSAFGPLPYAAFAVAVALAESAFIAYQFERQRTALGRENRHRRETLRTLRQSEQNFRGIFEHLEDIFYRTDLQGTLQMVSPSVERYGYRVADLIGRNVATFYPDPAVRERNIALLLERRSLRDFELTLRARDGTVVPVSTNVRLLFDARGHPVGIEGMLRDITERKRADEALRTREEDLRDIFEHLQDVFYRTDLQGRIQLISPSVQRYGYQVDELLGTDVTRLYKNPAERDRYIAALTQDTYVRDFEITLQDAQGQPIPVSATARLLRDREGRPTGVEGMLRDITRRKRAEDELAAAKDLAEAADRAKSEFLATVSHEIRTPMNGIIGMTGLLLDTPLAPQQRDYAETIRSSGETLLGIINDILDFSKIEAGKLELDSVDFDLRQLVREVVDQFAEAAQRKHLELAVLIYHDVPTALRGDPGRLRQILTNLLANAIKFTEKGEVVLRVKQSCETATTVTLRAEISDTGIGVSPEARDRLFRPFSQADASTTRKYGGTGLGLAICQQLTRMMEGEIGVDSQPGTGSTFWFTVRLAKQSESLPTAPPLPDLRGRRVLLIDDSATNRLILREQVTPWGMRSDEAGDGARGLELLRAAVHRGTPYDLAILDMQMPGMDGLALARAITADPALAAIRLLLLTSIDQPGDATTLRRAGIDAWLTKPVHQSALHDCLVNLFSLSTQPADAPPPVPAPSPVTFTRHSALPRTRVLVAEDNAVNQKVIAHLVEKLGYRADVVANGIEAVDSQSRIPYGAILMDCRMSEMDGFEATQRIRRREREHGGHTPIIALTANAMAGDRDRCLAAGMDDYIRKPVTIDALAAALARWVAGSTHTAVASPPAALESGEIMDRALCVQRLGGNAQLIRHLVEVFRADCPRMLAEIHAAAAARHPAALERAAHALKGAVGNFAAGRAVEAAQRLEMMGHGGDLANAPAACAALEQEIDRLLPMLAELDEPAVA